MYGKKPATKEEILKLITEYDIFKYYIFSFKEINKTFCSELTKDKDPSCGIQFRNNKLVYKDFRENGLLDCFDYIMKKYNLTFYESLDLINRDFNLNLVPNTKKQFIAHSLLEKEILLYGDNYLNYKSARKKEIKVEIINWNKGVHKEYWYDKYGIGVKDLKEFDIFPIKSFEISNEDSYKHFVTSLVAFGYWFGYNNGLQTWKIYQPYENKDKWYGNTTINTLQGYKQLKYRSDILIITKSLKDIVVLNKLNYDAVAPNSESSLIDETKMLKLKSSYKRIVTLYDNDNAGVKGSEKLSEMYNLENLFLPKDTQKDVSDYVSKYGYDNLENQLKNLLNV